MAEIPEDIREKARATADDIRQRFPHDYAEIIARAILAERERCAKISESHVDKWLTARVAPVACAAGHVIADAIRGER